MCSESTASYVAGPPSELSSLLAQEERHSHGKEREEPEKSPTNLTNHGATSIALKNKIHDGSQNSLKP